MAADPAGTSPSLQMPSETDLLIRSLSTALALFSPNSGPKHRHHLSGRYDQFDRMSLFFVSGATGDVAAMTALVEDNYVTFQTVQAETDAGRFAIMKNPDHSIEERSETPRDMSQDTLDEPATFCLKWGPKSISPKAHGATLERLIRSLYQTETADQVENATRVFRRYIYSFCFEKIMRRFNSKIPGYQLRYTSLFLSDEITLDDYRGSRPREVVLPQKLARSDESTLKAALEAMYRNRNFKLSATLPHRLVLDDDDQWAVWNCFKRCLKNLQTALADIRRLRNKGEKVEQKDLDSALQRLDEVEEDMGIIFFLARHSPSFWIVTERMAPLFERRLAPEAGSHHNAPSPGQAAQSGRAQDMIESYPLSTSNTYQEAHPSSSSLATIVDGDSSDESDDDDATSDVETTRHARSTRKSEPSEDLHEVISRSWSHVTKMARRWMKSITQWHHGFEDLERGPKKLGILSKNLAIDITVAPRSPSPSQQTSLIGTIKSINPDSNIKTMVSILRENVTTLLQNGVTEELLRRVADQDLTDEELSGIWESGFRGGIHCEAQLAYNILQRSSSTQGHKCLIGISKRCCFCCATMLKVLKVNDVDIVEHGKVYSWSPPCEASEDTKQKVLEKLKEKFQSYVETQLDKRHIRTPDLGSSTDSEDDRRPSLFGLARRFGQRMA
ncbi:hypothetical protein FS837_003794 [Tulasnella sp. UAMH 9824]|nr:hypothetical protein FS837_003794 [Tulasnella sp. UAMH 9824]